MILSWRKVIIGAVIIASALLLAGPVVSHASVRVRWSVRDVQCYRYSVTEYRKGIITGRTLWRLNERLDWCYTRGVGVWYGPIVHRSHWESSSWNWGGYDQKTRVRKLTDPTRWTVKVRATFNSNGAYLLVDHDHPYIRLTIWKNNPEHVHRVSSCGC